MEQSYKEKYEQALMIAKETYDKQPMYREWLEKMFPELKESEDEKVRKTLIRFFKDSYHNETEMYGVTVGKALAWLEKQGEQKLVIDGILTATNYDKMFQNCNMHKFNVGDWIIFNGITLYIEDIVPGYYKTISVNGISQSYEWDIDKFSRLWTIQDAKDGDVLATKNFVFIFKNIDDDNGVHYYCHYEIIKHEDDNQFGIALPQSLMGRVGNGFTHYSPATKEQHDLLFQKMKEARYEWDAENKQLNKIYIVHDTYCQENCKGFQETGKCFADGECKAKEEAEQKLVESEGEKIRKALIKLVQHIENDELCCNYGYSKNNFLSWLEKQGEQKPNPYNGISFEYNGHIWGMCARDNGVDISCDKHLIKHLEKQDKQKPKENKGNLGGISANSAWSEEDEQRLNSCLNILQPKTFVGNTETINTKWLKSLKDRVQPKQEWSEEDDYYRNCIIQIIEEINNAPLKRREDWDAYITWLKSFRPQNNITDEELAQAKKNAYNDALDKIEYRSGEPTFDDGWNAAIDYIRKKSLRPQNR